MKPQEIRAGRKSLGLSQAGLGELLGVTQGTVSNWEHRKAAVAPEQNALLTELFTAKGTGNGLRL